jgi:hypothetical protein
MIEKKESLFQPNTLFSCTGKVAGFLNHNLMVYPPQLTQDYIFMVVPDDWQFWDKKTLDSISVSPSKKSTTPDQQPSTDPLDLARYMSRPRQTTQQPMTPTKATITAASVTEVEQTSNIDPTDLIPWC